MKLSAQLALACFSASVLSNVTPRDPSDFPKVIDRVGQEVVSVNTAVSGFSGDTSAMQDAATTLVDTIISGNTELSAQATLSLAATFELAARVTI
ncbi:Cell wall galactomannoprotein [Beauveria brongniartii RCEF 3172]|uniref:Cell wall galactomannoprotein n=1 Tax=Beauveria brongniartii RCEF 3172 TaxID=1081107 RepID=A0A166XBK7_9HYPO|nr:Cell wall galactomannoprotein [Beauveria brongniartii RCEF 3172]